MEYRHLTNLRTPLDVHDRTVLVVLQDYRLGDPVQAAAPSEDIEPVDVQTMKANGIVGLYAPLYAATTSEFKALTGLHMTAAAWHSWPLL